MNKLGTNPLPDLKNVEAYFLKKMVSGGNQKSQLMYTF